MALIGVTTIAAAIVIPLSGTAEAQPTITITPSGPYSSGQSVTVSGTGFTGTENPGTTGLAILECSDPGGSTANLPTDSGSQCDATTVSGSQINVSGTGTFTATYTIFQLSEATGSAINCDTNSTVIGGTSFADDCVLWVGEDYNNAFLSGPHGFSGSFVVTSAVAAAFESPLAIVLPAAAALIVGVYIFLRRRRRPAPSTA